MSKGSLQNRSPEQHLCGLLRQHLPRSDARSPRYRDIGEPIL